MNNKGFAFSTMLYGFMIIGCLIFLLILGLMSTNRTNTRELVNTIEDDSARLSLATKTITKNDTGKAYAEYDVPLGFTGWYKIELWGKGKYVAKTVKLDELAKVRIFLGNATTDTLACIPNKFSGTAPNSSGYGSESAAETAYSHINITDVENRTLCNTQALILSTSTNGTGVIKQISDGIEKGEDGKYYIHVYSIDNSVAAGSTKSKNYYTITSSATVHAKISFISNGTNVVNVANTYNPCGAGKSGIFYIVRRSNNKAMTNTPTAAFANFVGDKTQQVLIKCASNATSTCKVTVLSTPNSTSNHTCNTSTYRYYPASF